MVASPEPPASAEPRCLSLDLEVEIGNGRIKALGGVRPDLRQTCQFHGGDLSAALAELDELAKGAEFLLGHNLIAFDLPHLEAAKPDLGLLHLPVVDTLRLSPLAFPRNPYHHLVKHYKDADLVRDEVNNPLLDARLALDLYHAEEQALNKNTATDLLLAWHWLTTTEDGGEGFDGFFKRLRDSARPSQTAAKAAIRRQLADKVCQTQADEIVADAERYGWALAYALAWLSVCGGNSVMPPWVIYQFPEAGQLVRRLRDNACADPACLWCREHHDAHKELVRWFGFNAFRSEPRDDAGRSMQQSIVEAAMTGEHVLAILPTGTGKSLCYQLPALSRYHKTGALTVVISPLVALMADQVTGLEKRGIDSCVTVNSMLSLPERAEALDRVRLGDASILIISPEQLRNRTVRRVLDQREIGAWVVDEAHCISKWGHDFRPDYRYVGRFISERAQAEPPPVLCLTATAKPAVVEDIEAYFQKRLGIEMKVFDGGAKRTNLEFEVVPTSKAKKFEHLYQILINDLPPDAPGGAIVYCATRRQTEEIASFLDQKNIEANYFHGGLLPERKKNVQQSFIDGELRVIVATNAFGMGIDKPDVRLVIHADIPGSLENYLQEAGRAGRDRQRARCVLLYSDDDVERQFNMSARSKLTQREIQGILKALSKLNSKKQANGEVIATAGEILVKDEDRKFRRDAATDDTRVRTAIAWLEEADVLTREENRVRVFPSSLQVDSIKTAEDRLKKISDIGHRNQLLAIVRTLMNAKPDEGISTDELMNISKLSSEGVRHALHELEKLGIANNDTALTAFVHSGVKGASLQRFEAAVEMERALIDHMREAEPDMDKGDTSTLHLRYAAQALRDQEITDPLPERLKRLLRSIAYDGRDENNRDGSLTLRTQSRELMRVTLRRDWKSLAKTAERRRTAARVLLEHLLDCLPPSSRGVDLLAETTLGKLLEAIESDLRLKSQVKDSRKLLDRALLWLHEQEVIRLNKGLAVFRPAMTLRLEPGRRRFTSSHFEPLKLHYQEQVLQIHVMVEYVQQGLKAMGDALRLVMDYFSLKEEDFLHRWLQGSGKEISRQTTPESWRKIVESLGNRAQREIVTDDRENTNVLVLAGPGSGKTRTLVHRIGYLVRVRRENPRDILALAYNRHAAVEIRRRLEDLIGDDARSVTVYTCHGLAMWLAGASFAEKAEQPNSEDFQEVLRRATTLLDDKDLAPEDADVQRERLLDGFRWILVDEYQDIDRDQYELISALAGRTLANEDGKPSLFAVGDDDQNIYAFKDASVEFINRFKKDYDARLTYLIDNYRSTAHIIDAANVLIAQAQERRMKTEHPIRINRTRAKAPHGGNWNELDPVAKGRVQILAVDVDSIRQAQAVMAEMLRLSNLSPNWDWSRCAVIARKWNDLHPVRGFCEVHDIPVQMANENNQNFWYLRETQALLQWLKKRKTHTVDNASLRSWLKEQPPGPWIDMLKQALSDHELETDGVEQPLGHFRNWLFEWGMDARRQQTGLLLLTAHGAKGLEFDHVAILDGNWGRRNLKKEDRDAPRRLYYVAMTRARETLLLASSQGSLLAPDKTAPNSVAEQQSTYVHNHPLYTLPEGGSILSRPPGELPPPDPAQKRHYQRRYRHLELKEVDLGFAGRKPAANSVHQAIAALSPGDPLTAVAATPKWELLDPSGNLVGLLAEKFIPTAGMKCTAATVLAITTRTRQASPEKYHANIRCEDWEVVVPELIFEPN